MRVSEVVPAPGGEHDISHAAGRAWLESVYARSEARYVRLNMITTLTGAAAGSDGTSDTLTSPTDRAILGIIRAHADVVVVGAATVRAEGYLLPRRARLAIVTTTGALDGHRLSDAGNRVVLVCPAGRAEAVRARAGIPGSLVLPVPGDDDLEPPAIIDALTAHGMARIVCEGGPALARRFADAGAIDEFCVTVAPVIEAAATPFLPVPARVDTEVSGMLVDEAAFSYLRLRPRPSAPDVAATA
jgi:riboflavin biosynthesis pyrimidine reductase